jgi:tRNA 2-thiouridine synthesizing protein A
MSTLDPPTATVPHDREVDARGLNCPLPILRTKKTLNDMQSGQVVHILATDPASVRDFQAFAKQTGNELVGHGEREGAFWFLLKRR